MAGASPGPRVSAHVVPKPMMDDEEKTTIDPQWDDGSTTSEQHKVSQRLRALEHGVPSDSEISATAHPPAVARLVVTHGSDLGRTFEIHSGKTFTIGRSLDCDVVLTDIAVSRKHFDLRNEDGWWMIADRGSGNGTLVNNDAKNSPFQLVNGDIIEVGTTTLRFDCRATEIESEVSTISGRRQPSEFAHLPELPSVQPVAPLGPQALFQAANARLPIMPTRPLVLGPHSPTLLGVDSNDSAHLLAALDPKLHSVAGSGAPTVRPGAPHSLGGTALPSPAQVARLATHIANPPRESATPTPQGSPAHLSTRSKYVLAAGAAATLATIVAIAFVSTSKNAPARTSTAPAEPAKSKFTLPVAELSTRAKPPVATARESSAGPAKPTTAAVKPAVAESTVSNAKPRTTEPAVSAAKPSDGRPTVEQARPVAVAAAASVAPPPTTEQPIETVVDVRVKSTKSKTDKRIPTKRTDSDSAETKAESLYRAEKFNEAADTLRTFARTADRTTKRTLETKASTYASFGKAYVQGMTSNNPTQAFAYLRSAANYDQSLGGSFEDELSARMKQVAPKAAVAYIAADKLSEARAAVSAAERVGGGGDSNVAVVKQKLESAAAKLYSEAMGDLEDNPSEAKEKFRQIKEIVDANSQWHAKASKQLSGT